MLGSVARTSSANEPNALTTQPSSTASSSSSSSSSTPSKTPQTTASADPPAVQPRTKINVTPAPTPAPSSQNPFKQLGVQIKSDPTGSPRSSRKRLAAEVDDGPAAFAVQKTTPQPPQPPQQPRQESDQDFEHRILSQIFRISVDPHHMSDLQGQRFVFLPHLNQELNDSGEPLKLSIGNLDQAIIESCSNWEASSPLFDYLLPCWKRAAKTASTVKNASPRRQEVIEEAKRLCMSN
ncbi:hypothetical protein E4U43_006468, partial [Claviceps pusilla]